jgi:hypothetical protein
MKRYLLGLALLGVAPFLCFFGDYFGGAGFVSENLGFFVSAAAFFVFPWAFAALCLIVLRTKGPGGVFVFIGALVVQFVLMFTVVPPGATCQMMGIAHRLKGEFHADELRGCADLVRHKFHDGTLSTSPRSKDDHFDVGPSALEVSGLELPNSLRGRFQRVYIQKLPDSTVEQVIFALGPDRGISCDGRKNVCGFFSCSIADGIEAYRYQRL